MCIWITTVIMSMLWRVLLHFYPHKNVKWEIVGKNCVDRGCHEGG